MNGPLGFSGDKIRGTVKIQHPESGKTRTKKPFSKPQPLTKDDRDLIRAQAEENYGVAHTRVDLGNMNATRFGKEITKIMRGEATAAW